MHRSFVSKDWIDSFLKDSKISLPLEVTKRFFSIVRIKPDEEVGVFDGHGREIRGILVFNKIDKIASFLQSCLHQENHPLPKIILLQAALEETKIIETIKRGTEYGIDRFIIFEAKKSENFCFKKLMTKQERLRRVAEDASRQSGRQFIPEIEFAPCLHTIVEKEKSQIDLGIFGDLSQKKLLSQLLKGTPKIDRAFCIVVGPEGGLSNEECLYLSQYGFFGVSWAPYTLRSELAGLAALSIFNAFYGRA